MNLLFDVCIIIIVIRFVLILIMVRKKGKVQDT